MYASVRLLLTPGIPERPDLHNWELAHQFLDTNITNGGKRTRRLGDLWQHSDKGVHESPMEFFVVDNNAFSLGLSDTMSICYQYADPKQMDKEEFDAMQEKQQSHLAQVAQGLAMALVCMNENPYIRFSANRQDRQLSEMLAESVADRLDAWKDAHPQWRPWGTGGGGKGGGKKGRGGAGAAGALEEGEGGGRRGGGPRGAGGGDSEDRVEAATLLIVDRLDDIAPALMHGGLRGSEYAPLLVDLFDFDPNDTLTFTKKDGKEVEMLLDDGGDPCWRYIRRCAYQQCADAISEARNRYLAQQEADNEGEEEDRGRVSAMRERMQDLLTEEHAAQQKFKEHLSLLNAVKFARDERELGEVGDLEVAMTTGVECTFHTDSYGKTSFATKRVWDNPKEYYERIKALLKGGKLSEEDKARLAALAILCMDKVDTKKAHKDLLEALSPDLRAAVENLEDFFVPLVRKKERPENAPVITTENIKKQEAHFSE